MNNQLILAGLATFLLIFLRGLQQKNVHGNHYFLAGVTSACQSAADLSVVIFVVHNGWAVFPYTATGAVTGILFSMWLHPRLTNMVDRFNRARLLRKHRYIHKGTRYTTQPTDVPNPLLPENRKGKNGVYSVD